MRLSVMKHAEQQRFQRVSEGLPSCDGDGGCRVHRLCARASPAQRRPRGDGIRPVPVWSVPPALLSTKPSTETGEGGHPRQRLSVRCHAGGGRRRPPGRGGRVSSLRPGPSSGDQRECRRDQECGGVPQEPPEIGLCIDRLMLRSRRRSLPRGNAHLSPHPLRKDEGGSGTPRAGGWRCVLAAGHSLRRVAPYEAGPAGQRSHSACPLRGADQSVSRGVPEDFPACTRRSEGFSFRPRSQRGHEGDCLQRWRRDDEYDKDAGGQEDSAICELMSNKPGQWRRQGPTGLRRFLRQNQEARLPVQHLTGRWYQRVSHRSAADV
ncbi:uncharacterized protein TNIN_136881 [Trichonephila inaurata madagascariensis]|uniref:Uncharacterized protein n=1 Tax=Trichonephila inaurata madagascariensis TaxID=2747483 RepID=A0A8X6XTG7_9ARAC|nr:uncharacterized protein TNIN_136881 [Trichonephila inaurata madagascariensis]